MSEDHLQRRLDRARRNERLQVARQIRKMVGNPLPPSAQIVLVMQGLQAVVDSILEGIADGLEGQ